MKHAKTIIAAIALSIAAAGPSAISAAEQQLNAKKRRQAEEVANAQDVATQLEQTTIRVMAKAGGNGRLFGTVTNAQVADALHQQIGVAIDRHKIELKDGIKALGTYPVEIRLGNNVIAKSAVRWASTRERAMPQ